MPRRKKTTTTVSPDWYAVDLHVHTPASKDYMQSGVTYLDILRKAEKEGLAAVAFTDHNTVQGYAAMRQEIADLERWEQAGRITPEERARLEEYRRVLNEVLVLPGFELTATFGFHVLAIFDPTTPVRTIELLLLRLNVPAALLTAGETEVGSTTDVISAYRLMAEAGALVIAAHANSSHGVAMFGLGFGGQTRIAYTQDPNLHALEVTDLEGNKRRNTASFFNGSKPEYPRRMHCIQGSDAHRITGQGKNLGVGERATELQLPEMTFAALKNVFLGSDFARTRPARRATEAPFDHVQAARAIGPSIVQSFHENMTRRGGCMHAILCDVVAFANTNGGTIYVGVSPNPKVPPKGVEDPNAAIQELETEIDRLVYPRLDVTFSALVSEGKNIVRIVVPRGEDRPYVLEGSQIYVRQEAETSLAMRDEIVQLITTAARERGKPVPPPKAAPGPAVAPPERPSRGERAEAARPTTQQTAGQASTPLPLPTPSAMVPALARTEPAPAVAQEPKPTVRAEEKPRSEELGDAPRTGVEIAASETRNGVQYHTMRDLRDGGQVANVTRSSARRLWRYAIALKEKGAFSPEKVTWHGDRGLWHKYLRSGRPHYDLVQRTPDGSLRIYYGVSEDGIHGEWRQVVGMED
ncbi:MAG: RNA-binding domain-containing protein [Anaerolineales bacterium]